MHVPTRISKVWFKRYPTTLNLMTTNYIQYSKQQRKKDIPKISGPLFPHHFYIVSLMKHLFLTFSPVESLFYRMHYWKSLVFVEQLNFHNFFHHQAKILGSLSAMMYNNMYLVCIPHEGSEPNTKCLPYTSVLHERCWGCSYNSSIDPTTHSTGSND